MKKSSMMMISLLSLIQAYGQTIPFVLTFSTTDYGLLEDANIVAGYVTTQNGTFIDTIGVHASNDSGYYTYLWHWRSASGTSQPSDVAPDALMGATRPFFFVPDPVVFNWDLRDKNGTLVPDGTYAVHIEICNYDKENRYGYFFFTKDGVGGTRNVPDVASEFTSVSVVYTPPVNPDADNDGMLDAWEIINGLNPLIDDSAFDPDADGSDNFSEYVAGTFPTNSSSVFSIADPSVNTGSELFQFDWGSVSGKIYAVQSSINLTSSWSTVMSNIVATPPTNSWSESYGGSESKFYRMIVQP